MSSRETIVQSRAGDKSVRTPAWPDQVQPMASADQD